VALCAEAARHDGRTELLATFRDLTDHRRAATELAARARQQEAVAELGRKALVDRDIPSLLEAAVDAVARTLAVDYAEVLERVPDRDELLMRAGAGWEAGLVGRASVPAGRESPAGLTLESREPVIVEDFAREPRCAIPKLLSCHGVVARLTVVIRGADEPYGVLGASATCPRMFSRDDVLFLRAMANVLADAISRSGAEGELRAAHERERRLRQRVEAHSRRVVEAQESERRRIARELHDEIGQTLTGLKLSLEDHDRLTPDAIFARIARARVLTAELLCRVHDMSLDLRPAMLDDLGLRPALVWLVERYGAQTGVEVALACSGVETRLHPEVETAAYRIVQEALTNVARHAGTKAASVDCKLTATGLRIEVSDEGVGFDSDSVPVGASSGLVGMEERARSVGGHLRVWSRPGRGATVVAELPTCGRESAS
jgi:signal transduction histidine kinase